MLIGKVRMIYLLTAMLAVGAGAGFASHEDAMLQVQAAEEAALEENTQTMGYSTRVPWKKSITDSVRQRKN